MRKKNAMLIIGISFIFVFSLKFATLKEHQTSNLGGYFGGRVAREGGEAAEITGHVVGHLAGSSAGSWAGAWIGGAIGSLGGPAGTVLGVYAGGIAGRFVGAV